jgi:hypothetical protein
MSPCITALVGFSYIIGLAIAAIVLIEVSEGKKKKAFGVFPLTPRMAVFYFLISPIVVTYILAYYTIKLLQVLWRNEL